MNYSFIYARSVAVFQEQGMDLKPLLEVEAQKSMSAYRNKYNFPYLSRIDYASDGR